jgi:hypothetical protein
VTPAVASPLAKKAAPPKHAKGSEEALSAYSSAQNVAQVMARTSASAYATSYPLPDAQITRIREAMTESVLHADIGNMRISDHGDAPDRPSRLRRLKSATSLRSKRASAAEERVFTAPPVRSIVFDSAQIWTDAWDRRKVSVPSELAKSQEAA